MEIARGAEALIKREGENLVKERVKKGYRLPDLDNTLRKRRTKLEARLLREARRAGVATPQILEEGDCSIKMEFIEGEKVRDVLDGKKELCGKIGEAIGKLHTFNIIHGDLTTSNMIFHDGDIYFIDFGLGFQSQRTEDKAIDLHLLRQVLDSTHFSLKDAWELVLKGYQSNFSEAAAVLTAIEKIEKRGRYSKR